jgi:hypothetical protein
MCICRYGRSERGCTETHSPTPRLCGENTTLQFDATESKPFSALISEDVDDKPTLISASHSDIHLDPLTNRLHWPEPIGSPQSYWADYQLRKENCTEFVRASISVQNTYLPYVTSVTKHKLSNKHRITGYIKFNGTKETAKYAQNLPVATKTIN